MSPALREKKIHLFVGATLSPSLIFFPAYLREAAVSRVILPRSSLLHQVLTL